MAKLWNLVQDWKDSMEFPPSTRQIALRIGVSPSTFAGWRNGLTDLPKRHNLYELHALTNIPFEDLMAAAIEDAGLYDPERAREASQNRKGKSVGRELRREYAKAGEESQEVPESEQPL